MKALDNVLSGLMLLAALLIAAGPVRANVDARVVTVGDISNGPRDATMWGFAQQYMPPESRDKPSSQLSDAEKLAITKRVFALQLYMNALATDAGQGRPLTDRDLIYKGEKLYLPPQDVIDKLVSLMPDDANSHIPAAKYDIAMHTVLRDVADNKDLIAQSKAGSNLTTTVLADASQVKEADSRADSNLGGQTGQGGVQSVLGNVPRDQELTDESTPTDAVVLGPDGQPISGDGQTLSPGDSTTLIGDITKEHTTVLQALLGTIERGANTPGPNQAKLADLARRIKAELARRDAGTRAQSRGDTGDTTASAAATKNTTHPVTKPSAETVASEVGPETEPVEMEVVPEWYLKSMQEWNLSRYWASKSNAAKGNGPGGRKILDPRTGKEKDEEAKAEDRRNPFGEFSDELSNYTHDQGQVQKSPVGPK